MPWQKNLNITDVLIPSYDGDLLVIFNYLPKEDCHPSRFTSLSEFEVMEVYNDKNELLEDLDECELLDALLDREDEIIERERLKNASF